MTAQDLIKTYDIYLEKKWDDREKTSKSTGRIGIRCADAAKKNGVLDEIKERKQEIIDFLTEKETAEKAAFEDRQRRIDAIEGLKEIVAAKEAVRKYHRDFDAAMDDEYNDGVNLPSRPVFDFDEAYKKYPKAAAYLKAQALADKSNYELSAIGRKAVEGILYGDWQAAIETMNAERDANTEKHLWD